MRIAGYSLGVGSSSAALRAMNKGDDLDGGSGQNDHRNHRHEDRAAWHWFRVGQICPHRSWETVPFQVPLAAVRMILRSAPTVHIVGILNWKGEVAELLMTPRCGDECDEERSNEEPSEQETDRSTRVHASFTART